MKQAIKKRSKKYDYDEAAPMADKESRGNGRYGTRILCGQECKREEGNTRHRAQDWIA
jgi:hypothetical protein